MGLSILMNWKRDNYDSIFVIVDWLTKTVYYKPVEVIIDTLNLAKIIINIVMRHYGLLDLIVTNQRLLFISKFWLLLCYLLGIKQKFSIAFYPQIDGQTKRQNNTIKAHLRVFINFE